MIAWQILRVPDADPEGEPGPPWEYIGRGQDQWGPYTAWRAPATERRPRKPRHDIAAWRRDWSWMTGEQMTEEIEWDVSYKAKRAAELDVRETARRRGRR